MFIKAVENLENKLRSTELNRCHIYTKYNGHRGRMIRTRSL